MKLMRVLKKVYCEPWLIRPDMHLQLSEIVGRHVRNDVKAIEDAENALPEIEPLKAEIIDGMAVIPIHGVIGKRVGMLEKTSGVTDIDEVSRLFDEVMADPSIKGVLFDIDSPGGTVGGVMEFAENIRASRDDKPIHAFSDGDMCSAAYWIGSQADTVTATASSSIGSVGVYLPLLDSSRRYEMEGLKVDVIKAGDLKAIGVPGTALTDQQRAHLQEQVDFIYSRFKSAVIDGRREYISDEFMQGQSLYADQSKKTKLIDDVVSGRASALDILHKSL